MRRKHIRVGLEFFVDMEAITRENVAKDLNDASNRDELLKDPETWEYAQKEQRLLDLLLQNRELLEEVIKKLVVEKIEPTLNSELHAAFEINQDEQELLWPLLEKLPDEDATHFQGAIDNDVFYESTGHIWKRLEPKMINVTMEI